MPQQNKNYTEEGVVQDLIRKHDIKIPRNIKKVFCLHGPRSKGDIGNGAKGKIDYLVRVHNYVQVWVDELH